MPRFQPREDNTPDRPTPFGMGPSYPIHSPMAIYGRQSTKNQVENNRESYEAQTTDLLKRALGMGWKEDLLIVYTENIRSDGRVRSASGRLRIDQREGLSALVERIEAGEIKAVMVYQEDRLFRDETGIQYNVFIDICKRNNCIIVTPSYTYDFNNDRYAIRIFRDKMQQAADFIIDYSKRMADLRARASKAGKYDGRAISIGYIVDRNRNSPTYKKYLVYEPHAKVVRNLFRRFRELGGVLDALCKELEEMPRVFPAFNSGYDNRDSARIRLRQDAQGNYSLTRGGLYSLLTNVTYIGWWLYQGQVVQKNNHPAIVNEEDFWYAFFKLSAYRIDGEINEQRTRKTRPTKNEEVPEALLRFRIDADEGGAYAYSIRAGYMSYVVLGTPKGSMNTRRLYTVKAASLDTAFVQRMLFVAKNEYLGDEILAAVKQLQEQKKQPIVSVNEQLTAIESQIQGLLASLRLPEDVLDAVTRTDFAQRLKGLRTVQQSLQTKLVENEGMYTGLKEIEEYCATLNNLAEVWKELPLERKRKVIELIVERVTIKKLSPHWLGVQIEWRGFYGRNDLGYLWFGAGAHGGDWAEEERALLAEVYPTESRETVMNLFPSRSWLSIKGEANNVGVQRPKAVRNDTGIAEMVAVQDIPFSQLTKTLYTPLTANVQMFWVDEPSDDSNMWSATNFRH